MYENHIKAKDNIKEINSALITSALRGCP